MLYSSLYFTTSEFACKCGCGFGSVEADIAPDLVHALHILRLRAKSPFVITSAARCAKHNASEGGAARSTHLPGLKGQCTPSYEGKCRAVDIKTVSWNQGLRDRIVAMALAMGLRVGVATTFLHLDIESAPHYPTPSWTYGAGTTSGT